MYKRDVRYQYLVIGSVIFKFLFSTAIIALSFDYLNSHKFFTDAYTLYNSYLSIMNYELFRFVPTNGFENMARIYKIIFMGANVDFITLFLLSQVIYFCIFAFMIYTLKVNVHKKKFICFLLFFIFDAIFLAQPSKDQFSLLVSIVIFRCMRSGKRYKNIYIIIALLVYAYLFRSYYVLILGSYYFIKLLQVSKRQIRVFLVALLFLSVYYLFSRTNILDTIINVRPMLEGQLADKTNTIIQNIIPYGYGEKSFLHYIENYFINLVRIVFPVETLWKSPSRGIFFVPIQLFAIHLLFKYTKILKHKFENYKVVSNIVIYTTAFILVQALFEPDFGSVFRHSMNLMPFYLYLYFTLDYKRIIENIKNNEVTNKIKRLRHKKLKIIWR
jgi:hypothetical protein